MKLRDLTIIFVFTTAIAFAQGANHAPGHLLAQSRLGADPTKVSTAFLRAGGRLEKTIDRIQVHVLQVPEPALDRVSAALMQTGLFTFVEPDGIVHSTITPNDPNFPSQWHLPAIQAPDAWGITTGNSSVVIAFADSGADWNHPDLAANLVPGWSWITNSSNTQDGFGHGTNTAGAAAAVSNNALGVTGVSWLNRVMPLQVLDSTGAGTVSSLASAITYAADHGVRIVNASVGTGTASSALESAVTYAWNKGTVVIAAAGNSGSSALFYPAACTGAVAVSATQKGGLFATYSDFGSWIDLAAPGTSILATAKGGGYGYYSGTSLAAPVASAVAALVLSVKPGLSASQLVAILEQNADDLGTPGFDQYFGYGQVNAYKAVLASQTITTDTTPPTVSISSPANTATVSGIVQVQGTATDTVGVTNVQFYVDGQVLTSASSSAFSFSWNTANSVNGTHTLKVTASDAAGNVGSASVSVSVNNVTVTDTIPPTVSIMSPTSSASVQTLGGPNVTITASASDNVAVAQVSFYIDGVLKCTDTASAYTCSWNIKKVDSGAHTIKVTAWDSAGNSASASETVYK